jgi:Tol biopolymer transport system component
MHPAFPERPGADTTNSLRPRAYLRSITTVLVGVTGALILASALTADARAAFPAKNGKIVFVSSGATGRGPTGVYVMNPNGTHRHRVAARGFSPVFSRHGKRIAFTRGHAEDASEVWIMHADGSHKHRLAKVGYEPGFSRNGKRIVYNDIHGIVVMHTDGSHKRRVIKGRGYYAARFTPNGRRIAYVYQPAPMTRDIWTARPDGSHRHRLVKRGDAPFDLAPGGKRIALGGPDVYIMNFDGTHVRTVSHTESFSDAYDCCESTDPVFSPNGKKLAFDSDCDSATGPGCNESPDVHHVWVVNVDGSHQHRTVIGALPNWGGL